MTAYITLGSVDSNDRNDIYDCNDYTNDEYKAYGGFVSCIGLLC